MEDCKAIFPDQHIQVMLEDLPDDEEGIIIGGNYNLLKTAFNNIVLNACKYSQHQPIDLSLKAAKNRVTVSIQDKGIGIPSEELKYIYDPFFRASNTTNFEGYGIGMPLANNIILLHKGAINVDSKVGVGTTVTISLPICEIKSQVRPQIYQQL